MTSDLDCLSLMELLDLKDGTGDNASVVHLASCPRCKALLRSMPETLLAAELVNGFTEFPLPAPALLAVRTVPQASLRTGELWRAVPAADSDVAWVVAIIGRAPDAADRVLVVPIVSEVALATDAGLLMDDAVLGYPAFADMNNLGVVLEGQLIEPVSCMPRPMAEAMVVLYGATLGAGEPPARHLTGLPVLGERDARLLAQDERADSLRSLWRPADRQVVDVDEDALVASAIEAGTVTREGQNPSRTGPTLVNVLEARLVGGDAEWDRTSLLEASGANSAWVDAFLAGRLDLTDRRDVRDLAGVLHCLHVPWEEAEPAIVTTLERSAGGFRTTDGPAVPMAARSRPGSSDEEVRRQLYADQSSVDSSDPARRGQVALYLADLRRALDELE